MLLPLPTPEEMATWDRETIQTIGIPGVTLMESASREAVNVLLEKFGPVRNREIFCFAGSGNNGGDAFAMARQLMDLDADVTVFHTKPKKQYRGETRTNLLWAQKLDVPLKHLAAVDIATLPQPDIIIDGLLGTGFVGDLREDYLTLVRAINRMGERAFVMALDIPSGLNGLTGKPQPVAIIADVTASFQAAKVGLAMPGATRFAGMIHVCPIGIPNLIQSQHPVRNHLISQEILSLLPAPSMDMHKGSSGHILILGGSEGLTGAPHLAALGALRSGAGLVTIACPAGLADQVKANTPDIMTMSLGSGDEWNASMAKKILAETDRFNAIVVGPGMGRTRKTLAFLKAFIADCPAHVVLDADALYGLAEYSDLIAGLPETTVLTPHPGEMARLSGLQNNEIQADRMTAATSFTENCDATLILKGAGTLVSDSEMTCISPFSEPNLAVGGSGDVLSGIIASLMAQGLDPLDASCLAVYWHGQAGRLLKEEFPLRGNLASEIANMLPMAAKEYISC